MTAPAVRVLVLSLLLLACPRPSQPTDGGTLFDAGPPTQPDAGSDAGITSQRRRVIYQLVIRTFGNLNATRMTDGTIEQNGVGKLADINSQALASLAALGVTDIWLTGLLRHATLTDHSDVGLAADDPDVVKGRAGSFYAVRDVFDVSPDYAQNKSLRMQELESLIARIHAAGLNVVIDLVPNHVARGHASVVKPERSFGINDDRAAFFKPSNHFYYLPGAGPLQLQRPAHWHPSGVVFDGRYTPEDAASAQHTPKVTGLDGTSVTPSADAWYETVKLNYGLDFTTGEKHFDPVPPTWQVIDEVLAHWQAKGVDGFRCDFAHVVPHEAWRYLIARARSRRAETLFVAEAYASLDELKALQRTGFDAIYHDAAVDELKRIYQGKGSQTAFAEVMGTLDDATRPHFLHYLENHDERRIASPVVVSDEPNDTGFGGLKASYQLAPLIYLYGAGPVLVFNGQELGEPGEGREGFSGDDGRTTLFDYWSSPEVAKWVNGHRYDEASLSPDQRSLRSFYAALLTLAQHPSVRGDGYWGLKYYNQPNRFTDCPEGVYSFARFSRTDSGRLLLVAANFQPNATVTGRLRIPPELADAAGLNQTLNITLVLDGTGAQTTAVATIGKLELARDGFAIELPNQTAKVWELN